MADRVGCEQLEGRVLMAADPITGDHPLWAVPRGAAVIDGVLDEAAWSSAFSTTRSLAYREGVVATVFAMYDDDGIYLGADVKDQHLWADGNGAGTGNRWQIENDDSVTFYFDVDGSRDEYLQDSDFAFGYNIANFADPKDDPNGPVRRFKFITGDGAGGAPDAGWYGDNWGELVERGLDPEDYYLPVGAAYMTVRNGTVNDDSDLDVGWTTELFLPWSALGMTAPTHGATIGMNFDVILDDSGGERDLVNNRHADDRWNYESSIADDNLVGVHSSYAATQPGVHGPVNYAEVMFVDASAGEVPAPITDLAAADITGYSAHLEFTSPAGTSAGLGHVTAYQIRYSTSPISNDRDWLDATLFDNRYLPRLAGKAESLRLITLQPSTTYYVAVRPVGAAGNVGDMATATFTTQSATQDTSGGLRVVPSPLGRLMVTEAGDPFLSVGDHLGISWAYTRQLFPGEVWDSANEMYQNFSNHTPIEGDYPDFFDMLQANGVNTMRVFLEQQGTNADGNPSLPDDPRGTYWLESQTGQYNPDMHAFLDSLLAQADAHGIYLILSPFSTYYYRDAFGNEGPWATNFGGPLTDIDDFFQSPETLTIAKNRMSELTGWVKSSPYADRVMGYEIINEWNAFRWTRNAEGDDSSDRAVEIARRAAWIGDLAHYTRTIDPQRLVINNPVVEDARGGIARSVFYDRDFDILAPHFYTLGNEEGINNPSSDRSVTAGVEQARLTAYWLNLAGDRRPILNGEWGPVRSVWPGGSTYYSDQTYKSGSFGPTNGIFTLAEDETMYSTVLWSGIASGQFGTPLRMGSELLNFVTGSNENDRTLTQGFLLSDGMRATQKLVSLWAATSAIGFDFASYSPDPLTGRVAATSAAGYTLQAFGGSDGAQGIVYVLQDRDAKSGTVSDGRVTISGLESDALFDVEVWLTTPGADGPARVIENIFSASGTLNISLPAFSQGVVLRFRSHRPDGQVEQVVALRAGAKTLTFSRGLDFQPTAMIFDSATQSTTVVDIAAITNFRARVVDMTPYRTPNGRVHLAVTDERHHLWLFHGDLGSGVWTVEDLTARIGAPGMTGDLTVYQPKWNAIHIGGLDGRGHAVNYWWAPGMSEWAYADLTAILNGPTMRGGLAGFVSGWGALNLAGLNDAGEVVVYWWAPGLTSWATLNMTTRFDGPTLTGQLSAFVTPWGAMNITGLDASGNSIAYWWVPGAKSWMIANLTAITGADPYAEGVTAAVSSDGGINLFGLDDQDHVVMLRYSSKAKRWLATDITVAADASTVHFPIGASSAGGFMVVAARSKAAGSELLLHVMDLDNDLWTWDLGTDNAVA